MSINRKIIGIAAIGLALGVSSCKKYLNVNTNPNVSQTATMPTLLTAAQLYVGTAQGVDLEIDGSFWVQYWTESPDASQYRILDTYNPGQDEFSYPWTNLYNANENFYQLYKLADSMKAKQYMAISLLMQAYTFELITDAWGDVPFTQALKGQFADGHITNPKYDSQLVVYNGILSYIDSANKLINPNDPIHPGNDDLIYGGSMGQWQKFSNTLKLRILLRMSNNPAATQAAIAGIDSLYTNSQANFIGTGDDAFISYGSNTSNKNPLFAEASSTTLGSTQNLVASTTIIDSMNSNNDPRLSIFFELAPATGVFGGVPQGTQGNFTAGTWSIPSVYVGGDAQNLGQTAKYNSSTAPVNLLTGYESLFLQAEVAARGWGSMGGSDSTLWAQAIAANFNYYNNQFFDATGGTTTGAASFTTYMSSGANWTLYPTGGTLQQKLSYIITQKWFAMCGNQGFEAWTEWRRTGYPAFISTIQSLDAGSLPHPRRFLYPTSESTANASYPGLAPIASPVWWDIL